MESGSFYITLPCNASSKIYPENSIAVYTTKLAKAVHLSGDYDVAMTEIQYPYSWYTVGSQETAFFFGKKGVTLTEYRIKPGFYSTVAEVVKAINEVIENLKIVTDPFRLKYDPIKRSVYTPESQTHIFMPSEKLAPILGLRGCVEGSIENNQLGRSGMYADINSGFYTLFVYSDIVQHSLVGNSYVQLLKTVEITGRNNEIVTLKYMRPDYIPVCKNNFDTISIAILTDQSTPVKFRYGKTIVRLHFRPRKEVAR